MSHLGEARLTGNLTERRMTSTALSPAIRVHREGKPDRLLLAGFRPSPLSAVGFSLPVVTEACAGQVECKRWSKRLQLTGQWQWN